MSQGKGWAFICFLVVLIGVLPEIRAGEQTPLTPLGNEPIEIQADEVVANNQTGRILFTGRVEAQQGNLRISSPQMEVIYNQQERQVAQVIASGGVRIQRGEQMVTAEKAVFSNKEQKITLTGNPRAWENKNEITGAEMILFLQEDRVVVNGGAQRVKMILYPEERAPRGKPQSRKQ